MICFTQKPCQTFVLVILKLWQILLEMLKTYITFHLLGFNDEIPPHSGKYLGCFRDSLDARILKGSFSRLQNNSRFVVFQMIKTNEILLITVSVILIY